MSLITINIQGNFDDLQKDIKKIISFNKHIMATLQEFETALLRIDNATTNIAEQLRDLKEQVTNAGLSAENEAQVLSRLETAATQLEAVGASVENPVPDPEA